MENKIYGYARVSTVGQSLDGQIETLEKAGVPTENIFAEKQSGKQMDNRDQLQKLLSVVEKGDTIFVCKLDRLGRSVSQVMSLVDKLKVDGVYLVVLDANIDTRVGADSGMGSIMQQALMTILGLVAEMERNFIVERTRDGVSRAKAKGQKFGPKFKHEKLYMEAIESYLNGKGSARQILREKSEYLNFGEELSEPTFYRKLRKVKEERGLI